MNTKITTKPGAENIAGRLFHPGHACTCFKLAWERGWESGSEYYIYTSMPSAVKIAESLQQAAKDRPFATQYIVID